MSWTSLKNQFFNRWDSIFFFVFVQKWRNSHLLTVKRFYSFDTKEHVYWVSLILRFLTKFRNQFFNEILWVFFSYQVVCLQLIFELFNQRNNLTNFQSAVLINYQDTFENFHASNWKDRFLISQSSLNRLNCKVKQLINFDTEVKGLAW